MPVEINAKLQRTLAYRRILEACRGRKGKPFAQSLARELVAAGLPVADAVGGAGGTAADALPREHTLRRSPSRT